MHRALVIGCNGQLGSDMVGLLRERGMEVEAVDIPVIDITDYVKVLEIARRCRPDVIINCAAYTDVDGCETNREAAFAINGKGAGLCAAAAVAVGARIVHISTDYVFDGLKREPYVEDDEPHPISVYGASKLEGERLVAAAAPRSHQIFRIAWLYGTKGKNFVTAIRSAALRKAASHQVLRVVSDQKGTPTYTIEVCRQIYVMLSSNEVGIFHCTAEGWCSRYDFARRIVERAGIAVRIESCTTAEFPRPAKVPACGILENARLKALGLNIMRRWEDAFEEFLEEEKKISCGQRTA